MQRRYRMPRRSPVIFWLLLAATISVDAVATYWIFDNESNTAAMTLYLALAFGQLSMLCEWAVLFHTVLGLRWLVPFVAGLPIALLMTFAAGEPGPDALFAYMSLMWVHVALILLVLWILKPTHSFQTFLITLTSARGSLPSGTCLD